ncbi:MAG: hypothetical protein MJ162_05245 [Treponema sp.]|nr:hypothetical protein [Treponema sp.]
MKFNLIKSTVLVSLILAFSINLFAEEVAEAQEEVLTEVQSDAASVEETKPKKDFFDIVGFCAGFTPSLYLNTQSSLVSAPSPIFYPVYVGISFPKDAWLSFQPGIKFWTGYYLVANDIVSPAEIENRTANVYHFLIDIPVMFRIDFFDKVDFRASAGIAMFLRYGTLAGGVSSSASGYYGTAAKDLEYINDWFFDNLRYVYLSGGVSFMFNYGRLKYGPEASLYVPISILTDFSFDAVILSAGLKLVF